ncbi:DUF4365 domain-containing protein [Microbacterium sp.]|uniref:DUF4365 domain-containing protein n=1 Tax=Microbacterium sp. TaxID=51671 RepID=UPI003A93D1AC
MAAGAMVTTAAEELPPSRLVTSANPRFTDNGRRGRYGVAYLRSLAAHAGVGFAENSPDEDVDAVDATLKFGRASAEVQVKCTGTFKVGSGPATLQLEPAWIEKWSSSFTPVYVVLVKVPSVVSDWIDGRPSTTVHRTVAFGKRFDPAAHSESLKFTRADLLTSEMLYDWRDEVYRFHEVGTGGAA